MCLFIINTYKLVSHHCLSSPYLTWWKQGYAYLSSPYLTWWLTTLYVLQGNNGKHYGLQDGTNYYTLPFLFLCPISSIEKIFMHILVFRPFQSSSLMITSQTTSMVRRGGRFSYNTHGSLKCSWRGRRTDSQSSIGTGLKLQRPSTWMKARYSSSLQQFSRWDASVYVPSMMLILKGSRCCMWNLVLVQLCNGVAEC